ncbi:NAD+ synthase (glutamine-hydrolysing) [Dethiosulfatibacter aminovorans DSM 17477]|uniref:Glutamine-dependent NAD(+) synthetase n=1 Tax=Dethiosulfatibacter aminovorans DSM 17477 TaxID=1121476 RepID=A0A1M6FXF4_9FIRM|nr:NAD(+) synthase [Dethiosulfatibacter aminovorans]SHJ02408.1 NAD+ synthase (glutamine-hydrolysing) [Dethiosulfatibacter aminovorans DSM 17477]
MKELNYIKICASSPKLKVADCVYNTNEIICEIGKALEEQAEVVVFPELSITGYTCGDLFFQDLLLKECEASVEKLVEYSIDKDILIVVGAPISNRGMTFNCAVLINRGRVIGIVPKTFLPNYNEFYEKRWFASGRVNMDETIDYCGMTVPFGTDLLFESEANSDLVLGLEICEDLWAPVPPSSNLSLGGAAVILNLSASNDLVGKSEYRRSLVINQSARCLAGYVYVSAGYGESSTDLVFGGHSLIAENGRLLEESDKYEMDGSRITSEIDLEIINHDRRNSSSFSDTPKQKYRRVKFYTESKACEIHRRHNSHPFVPVREEERNKRCEEIFSIQTSGLAKRIEHIGSSSMVIGISGGLDSTLALLVCVKTCDRLGLDRSMIKAVTMPGFGTTDRTYNNAVGLIESLGATFLEIPIAEACIKHFDDIGHDMSRHDITYENTQARERTQILMDLSNKFKGIVVGTGDLSELAMGWATYNGDHMSMYGVNASIPKTLVKYVVKWVAENAVEEKTREILFDVLDTPVSPELLPPDEKGGISQKTEDLIGPYELHDFFLFNTVRYGFGPEKIMKITELAFEGKYSKDTIYKWLRQFYWRFVSQQFKRSCIPDGPKVGSICLSPRGDWRMPSDASFGMWMRRMDKIREEGSYS